MRELTARQELVMDFIVEHFRGKGYYPTIREICIQLGFSGTNSGSDHIKALVRRGWLQKDKGISRGIRITESAAQRYGLAVDMDTKKASIELARFALWWWEEMKKKLPHTTLDEPKAVITAKWVLRNNGIEVSG